MKKVQPAVTRYDIDKKHRQWGAGSTRITLLYPLTPQPKKKQEVGLDPFSCKTYAEKHGLKSDNARKILEQLVHEGKMRRYKDAKGYVVYEEIASLIKSHDPFNFVKRKIKPSRLTDREAIFLGSVSCKIGR